jgi:hypothetical protein
MRKTVLLWALLALVSVGAKAQGECVFPMSIMVPDEVRSLAPAAKTKLEMKIRQIVTKHSMAGAHGFTTFSIKCNVAENTRNLTSGLRPMVTISADMEMYVMNNITGETFASTVITLVGAGPNANSAYSAAIGGINANKPEMQQFLKEAKQKIVQYYDTQTGAIIKKSKGLAAKQEFEEALYLLTSIPTCINKYDQVEQATLDIFQKVVDLDCSGKVQKARAVWTANQNRDGANLAGAYLAAINPASSCTDDAQMLIGEISQRIGEEWEWAKDLKEFGKEMARSQVELEKMRIEAARAIGTAWAENQQPTVISENNVENLNMGE